MSASIGQYASFQRCLKAFRQAAEHVHEGDVRALHEARVASRRLRELVPLLGIDPEDCRRLTRRLRKVTRRLGEVRELDVLMLLIEELASDQRYPRRALHQMGHSVHIARTASRDHLAATLPLRKVKRLTTRLRRAVKHKAAKKHKGQTRSLRALRQGWVSALGARVANRATQAKSAVETAGAIYSGERLHGVRIAVKKLRYAAELVAEARGLPESGDLAALKTVQDLLGRLHDLEVLISRTRKFQLSVSPSDPMLRRQLATLVLTLEDECRRLHARYMQYRERLIAMADVTTPADTIIRRRAS